MGVEWNTMEFIKSSKEGHLSKISIKKTDSDASPENLAIMIVQFDAVANAGRPFCVATYLAEGDDPIIFGVYIILEDLDCYVVVGPTFGGSIRTIQ